MIDKLQFALKGERVAPKHIRLINEAFELNNLDLKLKITARDLQ